MAKINHGEGMEERRDLTRMADRRVKS